jgi:hypothetical protein
MQPVEYRVEYVHIDATADSPNLQLVSQLNEWGREGWRVANVDLDPHPQFGPRSRPVLLEREREPGGVEGAFSTPERVGSMAR